MRNNEINPSGYYRIYQYFREMNDENIMYRELVPDYIYKKYIRMEEYDKLIEEINKM